VTSSKTTSFSSFLEYVTYKGSEEGEWFYVYVKSDKLIVIGNKKSEGGDFIIGITMQYIIRAYDGKICSINAWK
jgi:hypothetical protein